MPNINNYYERLVVDQLWNMVQKSKEPLTQDFIDDVACLALNRLPSCYVRSIVDKSSYITDQIYQEMENAVTEAIKQAIEQVQLNPRGQRN
ncbi:late competence development ComFB family protein [Methylotuvimicrobium sp. KM1]|uniref:late competence development ComFB family protein n=1 Tax=Methylotuvimicrobium sp. KM1 TaxID=3377707 RepID=UPI00384FDA83